MNAHDLPDAPAAAWLLPAAADTSQERFDGEQEQLIERCRAFVGMESDLRAAGDYLATHVGRVPIVVVRSELRLEAFHNVCRDRGAVLSEGRGNVRGGISGFHHRWRYES